MEKCAFLAINLVVGDKIIILKLIKKNLTYIHYITKKVALSFI